MSEYTNDPQVDREIIGSIEPEYFSEENFDASGKELTVCNNYYHTHSGFISKTC